MAKSIMLMTLVFVVALIGTCAPKAEAQFLGLDTIFITGVVNCSLNGSAPAPPFANATVQLRCPPILPVSAVTNSTGGFNITFRNIGPLVNVPLVCTVVVTTPLSRCNATLPFIGRLTSPLTLTGFVSTGLFSRRYSYIAKSFLYSILVLG